MRVVLTTYGSRGDVQPMVALAQELRRRGADVRLCAPPDTAALLSGTGVELVPVGWPIQALATGAIEGAPTSLQELAGELTASSYQAVLTAAGASGPASDDELVIVGTGSLPASAGAQSAAEQLGARYVGATFSPCYLPSPFQAPLGWPGMARPEGETDNRVLWRLHAEHLQAQVGESVNVHRASVGLPPLVDVRDRAFTTQPLLAADPVLGPWLGSPELDVIQTGAWIRRDGRPLPFNVEAFLAAGEAPVFVGFGSMPLRGVDVASAAIEAARAVGRRVLLASGWAGLRAIDDRDDCMVVGDVNHQVLFRRVAAVVHHGGAGTTTTAAAAGAPQVIVPQVADQPYWGGRVTALGTGGCHDGNAPTRDSLSTLLRFALRGEVVARAHAMAGDIRRDGAAVAAEVLLGG